MFKKLVKLLYYKSISLLAFIKKDIINQPYEVIEVPTNLIKKQVINRKHVRDYYSKKYIPFFNFGFRVVGSIRSQKRLKFQDNIIDIGSYPINNFEKRFIQNQDWESTSYYDSFSPNRKSKGRRGKNDWNEFKKEYLFRWEKIFNDLKINGYKTQKEISPLFGLPEDEIQVSINNNGEIIFVDGRHRFAMAKILGINTVPVIVNYWSDELLEEISKNTSCEKLTPNKAIKYVLRNKNLKQDKSVEN